MAHTRGDMKTSNISVHVGMRVLVAMDDGRHEPGAVQHWRMGPPDYTTPEFVSVRLDSRLDQEHYSGTFVRIEQLAAEES